MSWQFNPIGSIQSDFKEKFGTPRQAGLVPSARAVIHLDMLGKVSDVADAVRGLESFSHIWVVFLFDQALNEGWRPLVRPPRLGGQHKAGVFATRSPHRPNGIGISAVRLLEIRHGTLVVEGGDFVHGTPVLDIKPYVPYADCIPEASAGWAGAAPEAASYKIDFEAGVSERIRRFEQDGYSRLGAFIREMLAQDPRPAFQTGASSEEAEYSARVLDFDLHWRIEDGVCLVVRLDDLRTKSRP